MFIILFSLFQGCYLFYHLFGFYLRLYIFKSYFSVIEHITTFLHYLIGCSFKKKNFLSHRKRLFFMFCFFFFFAKYFSFLVEQHLFFCRFIYTKNRVCLRSFRTTKLNKLNTTTFSSCFKEKNISYEEMYKILHSTLYQNKTITNVLFFEVRTFVYVYQPDCFHMYKPNHIPNDIAIFWKKREGYKTIDLNPHENIVSV